LGYYGCVYGQAAVFLGFPPGPCHCGDVRHVTLAGALVAYDSYFRETSSGESVTSWTVEVRDLRGGELRGGRFVHNLSTGESSGGSQRRDGNGLATAIVLKRDGAVAWIVRTVTSPGEYQVWAVDRTGRRLLAARSDIAPSSLRLTGSALSWRQGLEVASATLD
jgi:hypothetical protein